MKQKSNTGIRLTYDYVKSFFEKQGCELLSSEYKNARTKLKYRCNCGTISEIVFDSFQRGNRCRQCGNKKTIEKLKSTKGITQEFAENYFREQNCELLDTYTASRTPMKYRCSCGEIAKINWNNFYSKGKRCWKCGIARRSGKHHYEWIPDRVQVKLDYLFRQRCYKILKHALKSFGLKKNERTSSILGYSYKDLQEHILNHPNWDSVKDKEWHVDHIFPIKAFVDYGIKDMKIVNALDNLQPLTRQSNVIKNDKYDPVEFEIWLKTKGIS